MIDFNILGSDKYSLTPENILTFIRDIDVFKHYIPGLKINATILSPLRKEHVPSFSVFWSKKHNMLLFKDHKTLDMGDCFNFVRKKFNLTYRESLEKVVIDFDLTEHFHVKNEKLMATKTAATVERDEKTLKVKEPGFIQIKRRNWENHDLKYWGRYGISKPTLEYFDVFPISHYSIYDQVYDAHKYAYAYAQYGANPQTSNTIFYKIYQPMCTYNKHITNMTADMLHGLPRLPLTGYIMIFTKSLKDVMSIYETTEIPVVSIQSEGVLMQQNVYVDASVGFEHKFILLDNDTLGKKMTEKYISTYPELKSLRINIALCKDYSDVVRRFNVDTASKYLMTQIESKLRQ